MKVLNKKKKIAYILTVFFLLTTLTGYILQTQFKITGMLYTIPYLFTLPIWYILTIIITTYTFYILLKKDDKKIN